MTTTTTPSAATILNTYSRLTSDQIADGMAWYRQAHELAATLDPANVLRAAGVISAFSPITKWSQTERLAKRAYMGGPITGHTPDNNRKVERILAGEDVVVVLNGAKTVNFALVIADPSDPEAVVVDRHAFDIAVGRVTDERTRRILTRKGMYERFADCYREAAKIAGISPSQMQACTWVGWRETMLRTSASVRLEAGRAA